MATRDAMDRSRPAMFQNYSGATKIVALLGHPVAQAKSPFGMTRGFAERGIDAIVVPFDVRPEDVGGFLGALDTLANLGGVLATVPHKFALCAHATLRTERADFFGSANAMRRTPGGEWQADMLDGIGFMRAIRRAGGTIAGGRALLVGAGGAGGAIAFELMGCGAASVTVHDTNPERRDRLVSRLDAAYPGKALVRPVEPAGYDLVINATPLGMRAGDPLPVEVSLLDHAAFVGDVVTAREETPLITAARAAGCACCTGHDMFDASLDLMIDYFDEGGALPRV